MFFLAGIYLRYNILYTYLTTLNNFSIFVSISNTKLFQFVTKKSYHINVFILPT